MSIAKFLGLKVAKKVLKKPSYMTSWQFPLKQQMDLKKSFAKNVKNPKWRAKTKLIEYSKKFI